MLCALEHQRSLSLTPLLSVPRAVRSRAIYVFAIHTVEYSTFVVFLCASELFLALDVDESGGLSREELQAYSANITPIFIQRGGAQGKDRKNLWAPMALHRKGKEEHDTAGSRQWSRDSAPLTFIRARRMNELDLRRCCAAVLNPHAQGTPPPCPCAVQCLMCTCTSKGPRSPPVPAMTSPQRQHPAPTPTPAAAATVLTSGGPPEHWQP